MGSEKRKKSVKEREKKEKRDVKRETIVKYTRDVWCLYIIFLFFNFPIYYMFVVCTSIDTIYNALKNTEK